MVRHGDEKEEAWAQQEERLRLEKIAARRRADERQRLKDLHYMHCPKCGETLNTVDLEGLEIDKCPCCHGIWLDPGEIHQYAALSAEKKQSFGKQLLALFTKNKNTN